MNISTRFSVIALSLAPLALFAQDSAASQADLIRGLLTRIDKLEKRVAELETKGGVAPEPRPVAETAIMHQTAVHDHDQAPAPSGLGLSPSLRLAGFSGFNFPATYQHGTKSGFNRALSIPQLRSALTTNVHHFA